MPLQRLMFWFLASLVVLVLALQPAEGRSRGLGSNAYPAPHAAAPRVRLQQPLTLPRVAVPKVRRGVRA